jgi:hypothetical protein
MVIEAFFSIRFSYTAGNAAGNEFRPYADSLVSKHLVTSLHLDHCTYVFFITNRPTAYDVFAYFTDTGYLSSYPVVLRTTMSASYEDPK